jgi:hypothetical protein
MRWHGAPSMRSVLYGGGSGRGGGDGYYGPEPGCFSGGCLVSIGVCGLLLLLTSFCPSTDWEGKPTPYDPAMSFMGLVALVIPIVALWLWVKWIEADKRHFYRKEYENRLKKLDEAARRRRDK